MADNKHTFAVAFAIEIDFLPGETVENMGEFIATVLREEFTSSMRVRLVDIAVHPDPTVLFPTSSDVDSDDPCDCSDHGAGYLIGMTGGRGGAPEGAITIQACNECRGFDLDDIKAALAYADQHGGRVHAIGDGTDRAFATDVWVMPDEGWMLNFVDWTTEADAIAAGWIEPEEQA